MTVVTVENHDAAYQTWVAAGVRHRTLVHLDAHHDMHWVADPRDITIGNFIARALTDDLLDVVYWVVPDGTWTPAGRHAVRRHLRALRKTYPHSGSVSRGDRWFQADLLGKRLVVCTLENLPRVERPLLDIDVDYLIMPAASYFGDRHGSLPWCWPSDVVRRLTDAGVGASDLTTIAYSVEGGYTPLQWKYLGDELSVHLSGATRNGGVVSSMECMRRAVMLESRGARRAAEQSFLDSAAAAEHAAPWYWLSRLAAADGRAADARRYFDRTIALDPSYYTAYDGGGLWAFRHSRWHAAERAFQGVLLRDPAHEFALTGLALLALRRKRWAEAEHFARAALARNDTLVDAHRVLAAALAGSGRHRIGLATYDRSLRLVLAGHKPFLRPLATEVSVGVPEDPGHASTYERIGELHASLGESSQAIDAFRFAIATGNARATTRARVAAWYLKTGDWRGALAQARRPPRDQSVAAADTISFESGLPRNVH